MLPDAMGSMVDALKQLLNGLAKGLINLLPGEGKVGDGENELLTVRGKREASSVDCSMAQAC